MWQNFSTCEYRTSLLCNKKGCAKSKQDPLIFVRHIIVFSIDIMLDPTVIIDNDTHATFRTMIAWYGACLIPIKHISSVQRPCCPNYLCPSAGKNNIIMSMLMNVNHYSFRTKIIRTVDHCRMTTVYLVIGFFSRIMTPPGLRDIPGVTRHRGRRRFIWPLGHWTPYEGFRRCTTSILSSTLRTDHCDKRPEDRC